MASNRVGGFGMIKLASLWAKTSKEGRVYYQGRFGEARLLLFKNVNKKSEKHPDLNLFIVADTTKKKDKEDKEDDIPI